MDPEKNSDPLTVSGLFAAAVEAAKTTGLDSDEQWRCVRALHRRPEREVFEQAVAWCASADALERMLGADVLAQLGATPENWNRPFAEESVPVLRQLLDDSDERVLASAIHAFGHLQAGKPDDLDRFTQHSSTDVRGAVAHALTGREDAASIAVLLQLMEDPDDRVRDWSTFAIGSQCDADTPGIRNAFAERLKDKDPDVRGEAMVGLAQRSDVRVVPAILEELEGEAPMALALDAAESFIKTRPEADRLSVALDRWRQG